MLFVVLLLVVAPLLELYVIIQVADVIGGWQTIGLLVVESAIGAWLLKRQGLSALAKISAAIEAGRVPGKELVDGFLILVAGALMLAPGFIGDVIGYLLLIPPTRALFRIPLQKRFEDGKHGRLFTMAGGPGGRFVGTFRAGSVFDATGHEAAPHDRQQLDP
ncbi:FxsA family protein [Aquihabitans sp. G128]|uniref:FxsA family protein n=1 Tax=Aquihabitans sp. G128 TaxID=2849779 RepID=UPI001C2320D6|nr:FxsA family protein [Aquihabitans sp. G128]QXC60073.1 FxsA family protein [Aquihabitans sp. G128]